MANIKSIAGIDYNGWELTYEVDFGDYNSGGPMSGSVAAARARF